MAGLEVEELRPAAPPFTGSWWARSRRPSSTPMPTACACARSTWGRARCSTSSAARPMRVSASRCRAPWWARAAARRGRQALQIKLGKLRGVESQGMLCSARELQAVATTMAACWNWPPTPPWAPTSANVLKLDDTLFTLKLTPNLGHALSVYGVAREVSALTGAPLQRCRVPPRSGGASGDDKLPVKISAPDLCGPLFRAAWSATSTPGATPPGWWIAWRAAASAA
jgi:phenylalanyl-tRNA synthetase beta chain